MHAAHQPRGIAACCSGAFVLVAALMVGEIVAGILAGSLALLADAGHLISDVAALAFAASRRRSPRAGAGRLDVRLPAARDPLRAGERLALLLVGISIIFGAMRGLVSPRSCTAGSSSSSRSGIAVTSPRPRLLARAHREA